MISNNPCDVYSSSYELVQQVYDKRNYFFINNPPFDFASTCLKFQSSPSTRTASPALAPDLTEGLVDSVESGPKSSTFLSGINSYREDFEFPQLDITELKLKRQLFIQQQVDAATKQIQKGFKKALKKKNKSKSSNDEDGCELSGIHGFITSSEQNAQYNFLMGLLLNALPFFNENAFIYLSAAVKMDPYNVEAWNCLGELYWKKGDLDGASCCFESAIRWIENKESLRKLGALLKIQSLAEHSKDLIDKSLKLCKQAVSIDVADGLSWCNSYLKKFFNFTKDIKDLKLATNSFLQSLKDSRMSYDGEAFYNLAVIYDYQEDFQPALEYYFTALKCDPIRDDIKESVSRVLQHIDKLSDAIQHRGHVKGKKLRDQASNGSQLLFGLKERAIQLKDMSHKGTYVGRYLRCKILSEVSLYGSMRRIFSAIDDEGNVFGLTIYNIKMESKELKPLTDLVALSPQFLAISFRLGQKQWSFPSIRLENPSNIYIGGSQLSSSCLSNF